MRGRRRPGVECAAHRSAQGNPVVHRLLVALSLTLLAGSGLGGTPAAEAAPRRLVLFIGDGFGPASLTLGRTLAGRPLALDRVLVGSCATASADSHITDSASAATALACGTLTRNLVLGFDPEGRRLPNLFERVRPLGLAVGVVTTTRVTHATPAAFSAHIGDRLQEDAIAVQQVEAGCAPSPRAAVAADGSASGHSATPAVAAGHGATPAVAPQLQLLMGGGRAFFVPNVAGQLLGRTDTRDLLAEAAQRGWHVVHDLAGLTRARELPLLALFADSHLPYELDAAQPHHPRELPSLRQMTLAALDLLGADGRDFVLVVEGGRIDHAAHDNDLTAHAWEVLAYDEAFAAALDFGRRDGQTLVVGVSDHETGGLALGRNRDGLGVLDWDPTWLLRPRASIEVVMAELAGGLPAGEALRSRRGIPDATPDEVAAVAAAQALEGVEARRAALVEALAAPLALRSGTAWSTQGHTAVDVPLFADGPGAERIAGHHALDELGRLLWELLQDGHAVAGH